MLTEEQIDQIIEDAGLTNMMSIYQSAIEIFQYDKDFGEATGYTVLSVLIEHVLAMKKEDE